MLDL
ncbi:hypothetical protein D029_0396A, partial [Vibrio parahaemolyticus 970107]|jgi:hypothetical protein